MKLPFFLTSVFALSLLLAIPTRLTAEEITSKSAVREYASARFMADETSIVWPDGKVTKVLSENGIKRPNEADYRMFWLTIAMNMMSKKGFEFERTAGADLVMSRVSASEMAKYEYASTRFMGDETSIVWPDGKVTKVIPESRMKRAKDADQRMFWLTISVNMMSKQGFELVSWNDADVFMRRPVSK